PAFFISASKGIPQAASLEIVNHEREPLALELPRSAPLGARLETLEPGQRFRLSVNVPADAPAGRKSERLELKTSNPRKPALLIGLNTIVHERVYTFPDTLDLGAGGSQTLMVYQTGGSDFKVETRTDVPGLTVNAERGPQGDRVQLSVALAETAQRSAVHGT